MKKILTLICTLLCANVLMAQYYFSSGQLYYAFYSESSVIMVCGYNIDNPPTDLIIPETVTYQGTTFNVTGIDYGAFNFYYSGWGSFEVSPCTTLTSVVIPNSVSSIGDYAFSGCSSLTSVTLHNSVTSIGDYAFSGCSSLTSVTCLRSNSPSLGSDVFYGTPNNKTLTIPCGCESEYTDWQNATTWASIDCIGSLFTIGDLTYETRSETEVKVQDCTESATSVVIPSTVTYQGTTYDVTSIGDYAFYECTSLTSVTIPNSVTSIGDDAFNSCISLTSITIPNSVTSIGNSAFWSCSSLTSVTIPNSVTSIGNGTFVGCSSLTSITIPNSVTSIGELAFWSCSSLTSVTIPNSVTTIGGGAFRNCSSLTSVTIPNSVTSIGTIAFEGCSSLTSMTIDMSNIVGDSTFSSLGEQYNLESPFNIPSLQNLTLGENVTSIASGAFNDCFFLQNVTCLATNPPTLANNIVFPYPNIATLTVPCGTLEAYSSATSFWNMFFAGRIEEDCSGLEDAEFAELSVYPNPTRAKVSLSQAIEKIEVIDLTGKTILTFSNANEINIEALPAGVYHLRMTIGDKTTTRKVIKD